MDASLPRTGPNVPLLTGLLPQLAQARTSEGLSAVVYGGRDTTTLAARLNPQQHLYTRATELRDMLKSSEGGDLRGLNSVMLHRVESKQHFSFLSAAFNGGSVL